MSIKKLLQECTLLAKYRIDERLIPKRRHKRAVLRYLDLIERGVTTEGARNKALKQLSRSYLDLPWYARVAGNLPFLAVLSLLQGNFAQAEELLPQKPERGLEPVIDGYGQATADHVADRPSFAKPFGAASAPQPQSLHLVADRARSPEEHETLAQLSEDEFFVADGAMLTVIDPTLDNWEVLVDAVHAGEVLVLRTDTSPLAQIIAKLKTMGPVQVLSIMSHGRDGEINLTGETLSSRTLDQHRQALSELGALLNADGQLQIFGCEVAKSDSGKAFIDQLAQVTGADVSGSIDLTGSAHTPGHRAADWELEYLTGDSTPSLAQTFNVKRLLAYSNVLATTYTFSGDNSCSGWDEDFEAPYDSQCSLAIEDLTFTGRSDDCYVGMRENSGAFGVDGCGVGSAGAPRYMEFVKQDNSDFTPQSVRVDIWTYHTNEGQPPFPDTLEVYAYDGSGTQVGFMSYNPIYRDDYVVLNFANPASSVYTRNNGFYPSAPTFNSSGSFSNIRKLRFRILANTFTIDDLVVESASANNPPSDIALDSTSINSSATAAAAVIGNLSATDLDDDSQTYALVPNGTSGSGSCGAAGDDDNASFQVDNTNDDLEAAGLLSPGSYNVCVQTSDGTDSYQETFTITVADDVAPVFENSTPSVGSLTSTGGTVTVDLDEEGTVYYVVVADAAAAPNVAQVKAGQDAGGGAAIADGSFTTTGTTGSDAFTGLAAGTAYDLYLVAADDEGSPNDQSAVTKVDFTTVADTNVTLSAAGGVTEPVNLATSADSVGEAVNLFDFTLSDGGGDGLTSSISQIVLHLGGTTSDAVRDQVVWRLDGAGASQVTGTYDALNDTLTFTGLSISVAESGSEDYTLNAYWGTASGLTEGQTFEFSVTGDVDVTVTGGSQMASGQSAVTNGAGTVIDVSATALNFATEPAGSVSGAALTTQPVVRAVDANGNIDSDFAGNISLSEASAGTLGGTTTLAASSGVATFTNIVYTASVDQESFTLSATAAGLSDATANAVTADVVASQLIFATEPVPTSIQSGDATSFTTVPVVWAVDADNTRDTGYGTDIVLSVTDPNDAVVDGTVDSLSVTSGDQDGSGNTVTLTPSTGSATFTGLALQYTNSGASETIALRATSGALAAANSTSITATTNNAPVVVNLEGDSSAWPGVGSTVTVDSSGDASVSDTELDALSGGDGDYAGASLSLQRAGGAVATDVFGFDTSGAAFDVNGSSLESGGQAFATFTSTNGVLTVSFTSSAIAASTALVNDVMRHITYRNDTPAGDASLRLTFSDGVAAATADVTATSDEIYITNTTDTASIDPTDGVSFSEAIAIAASDATGSQTLRLASTLAAQSVSATAASALSESLILDFDAASGATLTGGTLSLANGVTLTLNNGAGDTAAVSTVLAGSGAVAKTGAGSVSLAGMNGFAATTVNGGILSIASDGNLGYGAVALDGGTLSVTGATTIDNALAITSGTLETTAGVTLSGVVSGTGDLTKAGAGTLTLANNSNTLSGTTTVAAGTLNLGGSLAGPVTVASGATAEGTGSFGGLVTIANGGTLQVGGGSPASLTLNSGLTVASGGTLVARINGTTAGSDHDQFQVTGNVNIAGNLSLSGSYTATGGETFVVVDNDAGDAVTGTFAGLAEGAVATFNGKGLTTSYTAGSGNDFALSVIPPAVTDGAISITGGSGDSGAFKVGDVVTVTWDNTVAGDANDDINGVTVDFSAFGGDTAVSASESAGTWTATYTVTAGAIDAANLNVSVTATDGYGIVTTTADSSDVTLDSQAPTVSDARIALSGASGAGGAFVIGDTVTVTWDNTGSGDNNSDTIVAVSVDFSALGGDAAVAAGNASDTWSATYTVVSGAIDATGLNVAVTATDNAGNTTTTGDTSAVTLDSEAPVVTDASISVTGASGTDGAFKVGDTVTATWNNGASGANNADTISAVTVDFSGFGGSNAVAANLNGDLWSATYLVAAGAVDTTGVNLSLTATDDAGNATTTGDSTDATVDSEAPTITDAHLSLSGATGNNGTFIAGDTVTATWDNTGNGDGNADIVGVSVDFSDFGATTAVAASNSGDTWSASFNLVAGTLEASDLNVSATVTDDAGNTGSASDTTGATVDTQLPGGHSVAFDDDAFTAANASAAGFSFADAEVGASYSYAITSSAGSGSLTGSGTIASANQAVGNLDLTALANGDLLLAVTLTDAAGNAAAEVTDTVSMDATAPVLTGSNPADGATAVAFDTDLTLTFSEAVAAGTGNLNLRRASDDSLVEAFSLAAAIDGASLTVDPSENLEPTADYYIEVDAGAIEDLAGNAFAGISGSTTLNFTVANQAPVAADDTASTTEDAAVDIAVLTNDSDTDSSLNAASVQFVTQPANGGLSLDTGSGVITYTPSANFNGSDGFSYTVRDAQGAVSNTATVTIAVSAVNDNPIAVGDLATTGEDTPVAIDVAVNDSDIDADDDVDTATISIVTAPAHGSATVIDGKVNYTPEADYAGADNFSYTIEDGDGALSNVATVMINVTGINDVPDAADDVAELDEDGSVDIDVLANDDDRDGSIDATTVVVMSAPAHGEVFVDALTGLVTYTPAADYFGDDSFGYVVQDDLSGLSNMATVTVTVNPINDAPVARADNVTLLEDNTLAINVLGNDSDVDGTLVAGSVEVVDPPATGVVEVNAQNGFIAYTPDEDYYGDDSFSYRVRDSSGAWSAAATVSLTVQSVNDAPLANADTAVTDEDVPVLIALIGNDSDVDDGLDATSVALVAQAAHGELVNHGDGTVTYRPDADYFGTDSFRYSVADAAGASSNTATVTITVNPVNDGPVIDGAPAASVDEDSAYRFAPQASDVDPATELSFTVANLPSWASFDVATGVLTGTPDNGDVGTYSGIVISVSDGEVQASLPAFAIEVVNTNDAPVVGGEPAIEVAEDGSYSFTPTVTDDDADTTFTWSATNLPSWASLDPATGAITGTPGNGDVGEFENIVLRVSDGVTEVALPAFSLTVANVNDAPVAGGDSYTLDEGELLQANAAEGVIANDSDIDVGDQLSAALLAGPSHAANFSFNADGSFSYRHNGSETRTDSFTYALSDGTVTLPATTVSLAVTAVNDPPVFTTEPERLSYQVGDLVTYRVGASDPDSVVDVTLLEAPAWLTFDGNQLTGRVPADAADFNVTLVAADQQYSVQQALAFSVLAREVGAMAIRGDWQGLPAVVDAPLRLTLSLSHLAGPKVSDGTLRVEVTGDGVQASMAGCTEVAQAFECSFDAAAGTGLTRQVQISALEDGSVVVQASARDNTAASVVGRLVDDVSVAARSIAQSNTRFNIADATCLASIELDEATGRELAAGTADGSPVLLLDYAQDTTEAQVLGEVANLGYTRQILVGDVDGDSLEDMVVINSDGDAGNTYYARGATVFETAPDTLVFPYANEGLLMDLTGDGLPELVLGARGRNIYIYPNNEGVYNVEPYILATALEVRHFAMQLNGQNNPFGGQLAISSSDAVVLMRFGLKAVTQGKPGSAAQSEVYLEIEEIGRLSIAGVSRLQSADLNGDGWEELVITAGHGEGSQAAGAVIAEVTESGALNPVAYLGGAGAKTSYLADVNGDGAQDLILGNSNGTYQFYHGTGTLTGWTLHDTVIFDPSSLVLPEDVNDDGRADVLIYEDTSETVNLYLSATDGGFGARADVGLSALTEVTSASSYQWRYTLTAANHSEVEAENVEVTTRLPQGVAVTAMPEVCAQEDRVVTCHLESLPAQTAEPIVLGLSAANRPAGGADAGIRSAALDDDITDNSVETGFAELFPQTQIRLQGGGKKGGAVDWLWLALFALLLAGRDRRVRALMLPLLAVASVNTRAEVGGYVELGTGTAISHWQDEPSGVPGGGQELTFADIDDQRGTFELKGGYQLTPWLALEAGYRDWGEVGFTLDGVATSDDAAVAAVRENYPVSGKGPFAGVRASLDLEEGFEAFLTLQAWSWEGDYTVTVNDRAYDFETDGTDLLWGVGLYYHFLERYYAGVRFQNAELDGQRNSEIGVGVGMRF